MSNQKELQKYLETLGTMCRSIAPKGARFSSREELTLRQGWPFVSEPFTDEELAALAKELPDGDYKSGQCFMNAANIALVHEQFEYAEGFAAGLIPVQHAWLVWRGKVVDMTWRRVKKGRIVGERLIERVRRNQAESVYYGYTVPRDSLRRHLLDGRTYSPFCEGPRGRCDAIMKGLPWVAEEVGP